MAEVLADELYKDRVRIFQEYLEHEPSDNNVVVYREAIMRMLNTGKRRLIVNLDELRDYNKELADGILYKPMEYCDAFNEALETVVSTMMDPIVHVELQGKKFYIGYSGSFGEFHVTPRTIRANHLNKMISLEGIVTRCSLVRPKVIKSVHYCEATKRHHIKQYADATMNGGLSFQSTVYPTQDENGNPLSIEFGYSTFQDHQTISLQEMPERAPPGQLPRSIDIVLDDDLVDTVKPGDRVHIVGQYRSMGAKNTNNTSATFRTLLLANNVVLLGTKSSLSGDTGAIMITDADVRNINRLAKKKNIFELLSTSLAPSIYGYEYIKQAILLLLLGGTEKNLENGTHIRGDINILLVGDPSTAKSQMLRFVLNIAPLAIATTGRGSSGVGLTAAVTTDKETGERRLEAGAMVLADRGVAGIHTSLNARCSVLAAANPIYGQYDTRKDPTRNIALPDSMLSRFDLLFVVTDDVDDVKDRALSEHVLRMHRYTPPGVEEGVPVRDTIGNVLSVGVNSAAGVGATGADEPEKETPVWETFSSLLHANARTKKKEILNIAFVRKYIQYAKTRIRPVLSQPAADFIVSTYSALRNDELQGNQRRTSPLTARTLETLIRLSTAHAKARLSLSVDVKDARAAEKILRYALFREIVKPESKRKKQRLEAQSASSSEDEEEAVTQRDSSYRGSQTSTATTQSTRKTRSQTAATPIAGSISAQAPSSVDVAMSEANDSLAATEGATVSSAEKTTQNSWPSTHLSLETTTKDSNTTESQERVSTTSQANAELDHLPRDKMTVFTARLAELTRTELFAEECASLDDLIPAMNRASDVQFTREETISALREMDSQNKIMFSDNVIYRI
ncbi:MCM complex subunit Mcm3 [Schizosaccharomyces japonicus yFS275]|uniref:DNA replication licensing factor MCM3 n=1 Tax=Schizosaccharomyces japonicus (strain yFS275 / FY16936) TaxID=402676 RepID=B6JYU2_SCHJY|nr:MCM complex subunit Mcm3 [Schizosaccharomyces japonicus yFS275]EEB06710.2 MCM complex subunit Mcm3 [Schizosaccharomyces japonicus yFS275]